MRVIWISIHPRFLYVYFDPKHSTGKSSAEIKRSQYLLAVECLQAESVIYDHCTGTVKKK